MKLLTFRKYEKGPVKFVYSRVLFTFCKQNND